MRGLIIIPAYNEEAVLKSTLENLNRIQHSWDVLVVNDGSRDRTADIARQQGAWVATLPVNLGIGTAVQTGYRLARRLDYDWTLQLDADGQHPAEEVDRLLEHLPGQACVVGSRYLDNNYQNTRARRWGARYFSWLLGCLGCPGVTDPSSGFRLCDRRATALFAKMYPLDYPEVEARLMLKRRQLPFKEVPVSMKPRQGGKSSISSWGALYYVAKVTVSLIFGGGR